MNQTRLGSFIEACIVYLMWRDDSAWSNKAVAVITALLATVTIFAARYLP